MKKMKWMLLIVTGLALTAPARAELKWDQKEIELRPGLNDETAVAHFKYENTGPNPVTVKAIKASCGCTVPSLKSDKIAAGDKGELTATFKIGNRTGIQQKSVVVHTDDPANPTHVLMLKAFIPSLLEIQPVFVNWSPNEPLEPKVITVKAGKDAPVKDLTVVSSSADFDTAVKADRKAREWKISVTPKDNSQTRVATLTIKPDQPASGKVFYASARVTKAQ